MRALLTLLIFVAGAAAGGAYWAYSELQQSGPPQSRFRPLEDIPEPAFGTELRSAPERRDMSALAVLLTEEQQEQLGNALRPVMVLSEVRLLGAVRTGSETVIGYLVRGQDEVGGETVAGLVLNLKDNLLESLQ